MHFVCILCTHTYILYTIYNTSVRWRLNPEQILRKIIFFICIYYTCIHSFFFITYQNQLHRTRLSEYYVGQLQCAFQTVILFRSKTRTYHTLLFIILYIKYYFSLWNTRWLMNGRRKTNQSAIIDNIADRHRVRGVFLSFVHAFGRSARERKAKAAQDLGCLQRKSPPQRLVITHCIRIANYYKILFKTIVIPGPIYDNGQSQIKYDDRYTYHARNLRRTHSTFRYKKSRAKF